MEDAMILNAAAVQRGLAHGSLYKTDALDLSEEKGKQLVRICWLQQVKCHKHISKECGVRVSCVGL